MKRSRLWFFLCCVVAVCLVVPTGLGCGKKEDNETAMLVIGDLTDLSGPAQNAMRVLTWGLQDYCAYMNNEGLIPGLKLKVVSYDTKYDPSRYAVGYDWVKQQGAKVIFTGFPGVAETLSTRAEIDGIPVICASATTTMVDNPGPVFMLATLERGRVPAFLKWVYENDWEDSSETASIAMVSWNVPPDPDIEAAVEEYCADNPSQFTLLGSSMVPAGTMTWSSEVIEFKDCDYIFFGSGGAVAPSTFISQYRDGGGRGKILATDTLFSYWGAIVEKAGWAGVEGTLNALNWGWWTHDSDQMRLAIQLLQESHPTEAATLRQTGAPGGLINGHAAVEMIRAAVGKMGTDNLTSKAIYEAFKTVSFSMDGFQTVDYSVSREGARSIHIWKWSASDEDLVLVSDWIGCYE